MIYLSSQGKWTTSRAKSLAFNLYGVVLAPSRELLLCGKITAALECQRNINAAKKIKTSQFPFTR